MGWTGVRIMIAALLLSVALTTSSIVWGQEPTRPAAEPSRPEVRVSPALYFREITLDLTDGTRVVGRLIGASPELVRFRAAAGDRDMSLRDVRRAVVRTEKGLFASSGVLPGMVFGLYVGNGIYGLGAFGNPGFYLESAHHYPGGGLSFWGLLFEGLYAAAGGSLGWLASSGSHTGVFEFAADGAAAAASRDRFVQFMTVGLVEPRFHLLVQAGQLVSAVTPKLDEGLAGSGLTPSPYSGLSAFSYLRAIQLVRSVGPRFRAGLRASFPSEPMTWAYADGFGFTQAFRADAVHAVFSASPFPERPGGRISWQTGLGAGAAWVRLERTLYDYGGLGPPAGTIALETSELRPSAVAFTMLEFRVTRTFSAGVAADYTYMGTAEAPGLPDHGIEAQKLGLGNGSIGFILGFHF